MGGPRTQEGGVTHNGMGLRARPRIAQPLESVRTSGECCVMHCALAQAGSPIAHSPPPAITHQGSGQVGRGTANFLAACWRAPSLAAARPSRAFDSIPCQLVNDLRHSRGCQDIASFTAPAPSEMACPLSIELALVSSPPRLLMTRLRAL